MSLEESAIDGASPDSGSAHTLAAQLLDETDLAFVDALRKTGLLGELEGEELLRVANEIEGPDVERRHVDLLEVYFRAAGDDAASKRRRTADRFFLQRAGEPATAAGLVQRLADLVPELETVSLERIGGDEGPLVLRNASHFAAVLDHFEEEADTDEIDLRQLDPDEVPMVTVRGLVHALNVLLDRSGVRERLVSLRGDPEREVYVWMGVADVATLSQGGYLEDEDLQDVMELAAW